MKICNILNGNIRVSDSMRYSDFLDTVFVEKIVSNERGVFLKIAGRDYLLTKIGETVRDIEVEAA